MRSEAATAPPHRVRVALPALAVAVPFVVAVLALARSADPTILPGGDMALLELATREGLDGRRMLGPYSRFGWNHPGPAYFYLQAVPYLLVGNVAGLQIGALLINAVAAVATVVVLGRVGGVRAAEAGALVLALLALAVGPASMRDPWNPYVVVVPLILLGVLCAGTVSGRPRYLGAAAVVGSFCVQTNVATLGYVGTLLAATAVLVLRRHRADVLTPTVPVVLACALGVVMWLPPLIEQFIPGGGNLGHLGAFVLSGHGTHTPTPATAAFAEAAAALPLGRPPLDVAQSVRWTSLAITLAAVVAAAMCWRRGRRRDDAILAALGGLALVAIAVGYILTYRVVGPIMGYLVYWMVAGPVLAWLAAGMVVVRRFPIVRIAAVAAVAVLTAGMAAAPSPREKHDPRSAVPASEALALADASAAQSVLMHVPDDLDWPIAAGVALALERQGYDVRVEDDWLLLFGRNHRRTGREELVLTISDVGATRTSFRGTDGPPVQAYD